MVSCRRAGDKPLDPLQDVGLCGVVPGIGMVVDQDHHLSLLVAVPRQQALDRLHVIDAAIQCSDSLGVVHRVLIFFYQKSQNQRNRREIKRKERHTIASNQKRSPLASCSHGDLCQNSISVMLKIDTKANEKEKRTQPQNRLDGWFDQPEMGIVSWMSKMSAGWTIFFARLLRISGIKMNGKDVFHGGVEESEVLVAVAELAEKTASLKEVDEEGEGGPGELVHGAVEGGHGDAREETDVGHDGAVQVVQDGVVCLAREVLPGVEIE